MKPATIRRLSTLATEHHVVLGSRPAGALRATFAADADATAYAAAARAAFPCLHVNLDLLPEHAVTITCPPGGEVTPTVGAVRLIAATVRKMTTRELGIALNLPTDGADAARNILLAAMHAEWDRRIAAGEHGPRTPHLPRILGFAADHPGYTNRDADRFATQTNMLPSD